VPGVPTSHATDSPDPRNGAAPEQAAGGRLRRLGRLTQQGVRRAASPSVLRGTAVEIAWTATHVVTYPLGVVEEKVRHPEERTTLDGLDPIKRGLIIGDVVAAGTPIILVHGVVDNRSVFAMLKRGLRRRGFGRVITLNYSPLTDDVRVVADRLEQLIESVCIETGFERVHVIGHSMGGLVGRYFVQRMGGDSRVHTLVTLGTPHQGTKPAHLVPHPVARQMREGSDIVTELAAPAPGCRTRVVAIWSDLDQMIIPKSNARIEHADLNARNVFVPSVGHNSLPVDGRVVHEICTTLAHLDQDGSTLAEGATSIASAPSRQGQRPRDTQP
jgi:pimeloyl-ACP methyl ester carboxylesterase